MSVKISFATKDDITSLWDIRMKAQGTNLLRGLIFNRGTPDDRKFENDAVNLDHSDRLDDPNSHIFKATLNSNRYSNRRIVGFGCIRFQGKELIEPSPSKGSESDLLDFALKECKAMRCTLLRDKEYVGQQRSSSQLS